MTSRAHVRQDLARQLKVDGLSYQEIADSPDPTADPRTPRRLYGSAGAARNAVLAAMVRHAGEVEAPDPPVAVPVTTDERRRVTHDRYEAVIKALMPKVVEGDADARRDLLRALSAQADLYGLKMRAAPPMVESNGEEGDPVDELSSARQRRAVGTRAAGADPAAPAG